MADAACPLCQGALDAARPHTVSVCSACHQELAGRGSVPVHTTAEFEVPSPLPDDGPPAGRRIDPRASTAPPEDPRCTWCGREPNKVKKLLSSGDAHLCNECVALAVDILHAELGEGWRE